MTCRQPEAAGPGQGWDQPGLRQPEGHRRAHRCPCCGPASVPWGVEGLDRRESNPDRSPNAGPQRGTATPPASWLAQSGWRCRATAPSASEPSDPVGSGHTQGLAAPQGRPQFEGGSRGGRPDRWGGFAALPSGESSDIRFWGEILAEVRAASGSTLGTTSKERFRSFFQLQATTCGLKSPHDVSALGCDHPRANARAAEKRRPRDAFNRDALNKASPPLEESQTTSSA